MAKIFERNPKTFWSSVLEFKISGRDICNIVFPEGNKVNKAVFSMRNSSSPRIKSKAKYFSFDTWEIPYKMFETCSTTVSKEIEF
jgi:hypothetical protein